MREKKIILHGAPPTDHRRAMRLYWELTAVRDTLKLQPVQLEGVEVTGYMKGTSTVDPPTLWKRMVMLLRQANIMQGEMIPHCRYTLVENAPSHYSVVTLISKD